MQLKVAVQKCVNFKAENKIGIFVINEWIDIVKVHNATSFSILIKFEKKNTSLVTENIKFCSLKAILSI